jgi:hypothetical protein
MLIKFRATFGGTVLLRQTAARRNVFYHKQSAGFHDIAVCYVIRCHKNAGCYNKMSRDCWVL